MITAAMATNDWAAVAHLQPQLDALDQPKTPPSLVSAALWYAEQGLRVFPLQPRSKIPFKGTRGLTDATTDPAIIRQWWTFRPDSNIAIATGHHVDVIDIDGPEGVKSWARDPKLPKPEDPHWNDVLGVVSTPRPGGTHLYVAASPKQRNGANLKTGIDIRALGGYVVAPPSINADGITYRWRRPLNLSRHA
jgi:hypothetical protein